VGFALLALVGGQRLVYSGKILPGTEMAGVSLGGASEQEARTRLAAISTDDRAMTFSHGGRLVRIRGRRIGFRIDVAESVSRAMRAGRRGPLAGLGSTVTAMFVPRSVTPIYTARRRALARVVKDWPVKSISPRCPGVSTLTGARSASTWWRPCADACSTSGPPPQRSLPVFVAVMRQAQRFL
jgi:hypothetical protein